MQSRHALSCYIIGEGTLPIQCADVLLNRGLTINGIISADAGVKRWAKAKDIPHIAPTDDVIAFVSGRPCDYLFSIVNGYILPKEILGLPRQYAINYHNALLPKYAGSNVTSWAIMARETVHGVTWHVMSDLVDGGDILQQCPVDIADSDTALTLNAKCYEAAIRSFATLIDDLSHGQAVGKKQNLQERTFFPRYKRPPVGCVFSWNRCAYDIDAFVRALDFAPYVNPIGLPKFAIAGDFIGVCKIEVLNSLSEAPPGTITGLDGESIRVSTTSRDVVLRQLLTIDGRPLAIADVVRRFGLQEGYRFRDVDAELARHLTEVHASICRHEAFWVERLATLQPLALPYAARHASSRQTARYASVPVPIPAAVLRYLASCQMPWDLSDFLLAAFVVYLARVGHVSRFDIAYSEVEMRHDLTGLDGFFAPQVPLRLDIDSAQGFTATCRAVREQVESIRRHKTYARDAVARYPALRSIPELQGGLTLPVSVKRVATLNDDAATSDCEFTLLVPSGGTECCWVYDTAVLDQESIARMRGQFTVLLQGIVAAPERCIAGLPLLTESEQRQLLVEFNDSAACAAEDRCIHQLFEAQVEQAPDAVAVVCPATGAEHDAEAPLTYRQLNRRANQLAHYLQALGVGPDVLVAICVERSAEMVIGLLGILKAGAAYVPLDPSYPKERLAIILQETQAPVLLTQQWLTEALPEHGARVVCLDADWEAIDRESAANPISGVMADNIAYVIYTSGSTGRPKGVMVSHHAIRNRLLWGQMAYPLDATDGVLQLASFSFDFSVWEFFAPLLAGARLILPPPAQQLDNARITRLIAEQKITTVHFVPSMLEVFLAQHDLEACNCLRRVFCGGEALSVKLQERFFSRLHADLYNQYGPTEACVDVTFWTCDRSGPQQLVPIGRPISNTQIYILDSHLQPVPVGVAGELYIGGIGLARGYLHHPDLTAEKFLPHPFSNEPGARLYKSGDLARYLPDGSIEFLGRLDHQVKIRGFRIELGEIETVLGQHPAVREAVVMARQVCSADTRLVAYVVPNQQPPPSTSELRRFLAANVPDYMLPSAFVFLDTLPRTPAGKMDRGALPAPEPLRPELAAAYVPPKTGLERQVVQIWQEVLGIEQVGVHDNFFDLGGHSLLVVSVQSKLRELLGREISVIDMFRYPTIRSLVHSLDHDESEPSRCQSLHHRARRPALDKHAASAGIAIIGMACCFPGAKNIAEFWHNLRDGVESVAFFSDDELAAAGVDPTALADPNYVKAGCILDNVELFDAQFFGFTPREAEIMDPQHRLFLMCAWEALENAGYDPEAYPGLIGTYAGTGTNSYLLNNLRANRHRIEALDAFETTLLSAKDFVTTRVAYELNLRGPAVTVQTACSTSLVAVHMACQSLLHYQCDITLAGGVSVKSPHKKGYVYQEGMILSPDGHCRAFDARAQGTVIGSGVGIVVLKRLADAIADNDCVYAVIKGSAINNDGAAKIGYTAPSVDGQAAVIAMAQAIAGIEPETISYIEAHGTGTPLGDPIEIAGLTQAFRGHSRKSGFCAIGSVKTNIGHTDAAAGAAGLIKTVLALQHQLLPPSLHFETPNPQIDFANSPFYVNTRLTPWESNGTPRRAGVSSFGIGGTNAHMVLEEAPATAPSSPSRPWQLLLLSAKTSTALATTTANLVTHLQRHPEVNLADVAFTLQVGRQTFNHRRMLVCRDHAEALSALDRLAPDRVFTSVLEPGDRPLAFMFPGQGAQYIHMAAELYQTEPMFRQQLDACSEFLKPHVGLDLRDVLYPSADHEASAARQLHRTATTQPALFAVEYALARLFMAWGIKPQAMIGHSLGEYVAACVAGVFSLEDALTLVASRGRLMDQLPAGAMLAVPLPAQEVAPLLGDTLSLAAINAPSLCVVSGPIEAVEPLAKRLTEKGTSCRRLHTSHAFHSHMMDPILQSFIEEVKKVKLHAPQIPYISNLTGTWITAAEATDAHYWSRHLRHTVRFSDGLQELLQDTQRLFLEVGPGQTLSSLAKQDAHQAGEQVMLSTLRHPLDQRSDVNFLLHTIGRLWLAGIPLHWPGFYANERRQRVALPTYPFEGRRFWSEPQKASSAEAARPLALDKKPDVADWFYTPSWKRSVAPALLHRGDITEPRLCWLVFTDPCGLGAQIVTSLQRQHQEVVSVQVGEQFRKAGDALYTINPQVRDDYDCLIEALRAHHQVPHQIVHLWSVSPNAHRPSDTEGLEQSQNLGLYSLLFLVQALSDQNVTDPLRIDVISNHLQEVTGEELLCPEKATVLGACKVMPHEYAHISCSSIDIVVPESHQLEPRLVSQLLAELRAPSADAVVAYRGLHRWVQTFEPVHMQQSRPAPARLRDQGVYLITGGLGGIGLALAAHLAKTVRAKLVLTGRSAFPPRDAWQRWLSTHNEQDDVSIKIQQLQAMERLGAEILVCRADVARQEQMRAVMTQTKERFGHIHGVIHCAGVPDSAGVMHKRSRQMMENILAPKVQGVRVLDHLLENVALDFFVLCSSLGSILTHTNFGQVGSAAAHEFLDAFAHYKNRRDSTFTVAINWSDWQYAPYLQKDGLLPAEGIEAFHRILDHAFPRIAVSTQDLTRLSERHLASLGVAWQPDLCVPEHARPALEHADALPWSQTERTLAGIWQQLLGLEQVGRHENFFDLGGHSLLATQIIARVRNIFHIDLPVRALFENPTIAGLSVEITNALTKTLVVPDEIADMLTQLEALSPEETRRQLTDT